MVEKFNLIGTTRNPGRPKKLWHIILQRIGLIPINISDPDDDITEIKLIDPKDYKQYFDWGENGDRIMKKAIEKLNQY